MGSPGNAWKPQIGLLKHIDTLLAISNMLCALSFAYINFWLV